MRSVRLLRWCGGIDKEFVHPPAVHTSNARTQIEDALFFCGESDWRRCRWLVGVVEQFLVG